MSRHPFSPLSLALFVSLSLLLASCGSAASPLPTVMVTASDTAYMSGELLIGPQTIIFRNQGSQPHSLTLALLRPGKTPEDYRAALKAGDMPVARAMLFYSGGTSAVPPGGEARFTLELFEGQYALLSQDPRADESSGPLSFTLPVNSERKAPALPEGDYSVRLDDSRAIPLPEKLSKGARTFRGEGVGPGLHSLQLWKLHPGAKDENLNDWIRAGRTGERPADLIAGTGTLSPGAATLFTVTLEAGSYVATDGWDGPTSASSTSFTLK